MGGTNLVYDPVNWLFDPLYVEASQTLGTNELGTANARLTSSPSGGTFGGSCTQPMDLTNQANIYTCIFKVQSLTHCFFVGMCDRDNYTLFTGGAGNLGKNLYGSSGSFAGGSTISGSPVSYGVGDLIKIEIVYETEWKTKFYKNDILIFTANGLPDGRPATSPWVFLAMKCNSNEAGVVDIIPDSNLVGSLVQLTLANDELTIDKPLTIGDAVFDSSGIVGGSAFTISSNASSSVVVDSVIRFKPDNIEIGNISSILGLNLNDPHYVGGVPQQNTSTTSNVTFNDGTFNGNLTVNGTTTTLNTETITVEDPIIELGTNNSTTTKDLGFYCVSNTNQYSGLIRDATNAVWYLTNLHPSKPVEGVNYSTNLAKLYSAEQQIGSMSIVDIGGDSVVSHSGNESYRIKPSGKFVFASTPGGLLNYGQLNNIQDYEPDLEVIGGRARPMFEFGTYGSLFTNVGSAFSYIVSANGNFGSTATPATYTANYMRLVDGAAVALEVGFSGTIELQDALMDIAIGYWDDLNAGVTIINESKVQAGTNRGFVSSGRLFITGSDVAVNRYYTLLVFNNAGGGKDIRYRRNMKLNISAIY